jgi:hypothetical protein
MWTAAGREPGRQDPDETAEAREQPHRRKHCDEVVSLPTVSQPRECAAVTDRRMRQFCGSHCEIE